MASYYLFLDISAIADEDGFSYFETSIKDDDPNAKIKKITNYFIEPYKIVSTFSSSATKDEGTEKRKIECTYKFDKYGNITFMEYSSTITNSIKKDDAKYTITNKEHYKLEASYKD